MSELVFNIADELLLSPTLPTILVDADGIVLSASPATSRLCASSVDRPLSEAFDISAHALAEHLASDGQSTLVGHCFDAHAHINYVVAQAIKLQQRPATLIVFTDLRPSRQAEEKRFDVTPYPVLRLSADGRIQFANEQAQCKLGANLI